MHPLCNPDFISKIGVNDVTLVLSLIPRIKQKIITITDD